MEKPLNLNERFHNGVDLNFVDCCKVDVVFKKCLNPKAESGSRSDFTSAYAAG